MALQRNVGSPHTHTADIIACVLVSPIVFEVHEPSASSYVSLNHSLPVSSCVVTNWLRCVCPARVCVGVWSSIRGQVYRL